MLGGKAKIFERNKVAVFGIGKHAANMLRNKFCVCFANSCWFSSGFVCVYHWTTSLDQLMVCRWITNKMVMNRNAIAMNVMAIA